jgi:hypothetical protein
MMATTIRSSMSIRVVRFRGTMAAAHVKPGANPVGTLDQVTHGLRMGGPTRQRRVGSCKPPCTRDTPAFGDSDD